MTAVTSVTGPRGLRPSAMTRVLVTGGTGFIGVRVLRRLIAQGATPRIFDLPQALARAALPAGCEAAAGDVADPEAVATAAGCDGIVHLAGIMTVDCARDPARAIRINLSGSLAVFEAARAARLPVAYLSAAGVFGPEDAANPWPMTVYGVTKLAVEGLARVFAADHGVPSLGLRPYIVYGPGISSGIAAGPSIALAAAMKREAAVTRFSGRVGFVHADDVAGLLVADVSRGIKGATTLTLAGDVREMEDFVQEIARRTG